MATTTVAPVEPSVDVSLGLKTQWDPDYSDPKGEKANEIAKKIEDELKKGNDKIDEVSISRIYKDPKTGKPRVDLKVEFKPATPVDDDLAKSVNDNIKSSIDDGSLDSIGVDPSVPVTSTGNYIFFGASLLSLIV